MGMSKSKLQTTVVIASALATAGSLVADGVGIAPDFPWQWFALGGFIVFAFITWIKVYQLESKRPQITLGDKTNITQNIIDTEKKAVNVLQLYYKNSGELPAYRFSMRVGYAIEGNPSSFVLFSQNSSANPIFPSAPEQGIIHTFTFQYQEKDGKMIVTQVPKGVLVHCKAEYSNKPYNGKMFNDEWWYSYRLDKQMMSHLSIPRKNELEPYVRLAYKNKSEKVSE